MYVSLIAALNASERAARVSVSHLRFSLFSAATAVVAGVHVSLLSLAWQCDETCFPVVCRCLACHVIAVGVCQTVYTVLVSLGGSAYLSSLQKFAILISALVHDLDHPGKS